ncbi:MAG: heme ABC transporter ATP-binding protein [Dehalococcoidia bacterium]
MLEARAVSFHVGARALVQEVSLDLRPGEILALVGPNGAGKSTLLRLLAGDLQPSAGAVLLDEAPLRTYGARALALRRAVLPQQTVLQFAFSAREVVLMGRSPHLGFAASERGHDHEVVDWAMSETDTLDLAARSFPTLSGGEQQRVSLARVLAQEAPIVLLDEPTASLDIHHQELVMETARSMAAGGTAVLTVLHDLNLAAAAADRVAVLHQGRLAALGPPREVCTEELLSEVFEHPMAVLRHPVRDCPLIVPLPRDAAGQAARLAEATSH